MSDNSLARLFTPNVVQHRRLPAWRRLTCWLRSTKHTVVTRRQLAEMDERMLSDIGVSRADALDEASRPFWNQKRPDFWP